MWSEAESSCLAQRAATMCWEIIRETHWIPGNREELFVKENEIVAKYLVSHDK